LDTPAAAAESARTFAINTAALKQLGGKADTGELSLAYDFKTKNQI
jgi:hypothetical protein